MMQEFLDYITTNFNYILNQFTHHFLLTLYGVLIACVVGIPIGFIIAKKKRLAPWVLSLGNIIQTISSLAMLALLMVIMGIGSKTVVFTVFLYSLLPIITNTYTGVKELDEGVIDIAKGIGMTPLQIVWKIEFPLALPIILGGIRNAFVIGVGISAVGTFIGAGGLGDIISRGVNVTNGGSIIWVGALATCLMAIVIDGILGYIENKFKV